MNKAKEAYFMAQGVCSITKSGAEFQSSRQGKQDLTKARHCLRNTARILNE